MDITKAFEVINGYVSNPDENTDGPFYTGGPSSPVGLDLPVRTFYLQNDATGVVIWRKFGAGVNDWRQLSAVDIPYDPSGDLNLDPSDTDLDKAMRKLANISLSELAEIEGFVSNNLETTTSNGWVSKTGFPWLTTDTKTAGTYSLRWFAEVGQTKGSRNFGFAVRWRAEGGTVADLSELTTVEISSDNGRIQQSGFKEVILPSDTKIEMDVQHGQTTDGFSSILSNVSVEVRRVGD